MSLTPLLHGAIEIFLNLLKKAYNMLFHQTNKPLWNEYWVSFIHGPLSSRISAGISSGDVFVNQRNNSSELFTHLWAVDCCSGRYQRARVERATASRSCRQRALWKEAYKSERAIYIRDVSDGRRCKGTKLLRWQNHWTNCEYFYVFKQVKPYIKCNKVQSVKL
jgi:hypothetical protein